MAALNQRAAALALVLIAAAPALAVDCHSMKAAFDAEVCVVDAAKDPLELRLLGPDQKPLTSLAALKQMAPRPHGNVLFAMNAGMFDRNHGPVGLLVESGRTLAPLNLKRGLGNFYLRPNGVFYVARRRAAIATTEEFESLSPTDVTIATQSGPMLVVAGSIPNTLSPRSESRFTRNGVGITPEGRIAFAISRVPVSLYAFAAFFRDTLKCQNALYLDGHVSSLLTQDVAINGDGLGPMFVIFGE